MHMYLKTKTKNKRKENMHVTSVSPVLLSVAQEIIFLLKVVFFCVIVDLIRIWRKNGAPIVTVDHFKPFQTRSKPIQIFNEQNNWTFVTIKKYIKEFTDWNTKTKATDC